MSGGGFLNRNGGTPRSSNRPAIPPRRSHPPGVAHAARGRPIAPGDVQESHVLVYESNLEQEVGVHSLLDHEGYELTVCEDGEC